MISTQIHIDLIKNILFLHEGDFTDIYVESYVEELETILDKIPNGTTNLKKKSIFSFVELFQNVIRHGKKQNPEKPQGLILLGIQENFVYIECYNYIESENIPKLLSSIESVNQMSQEQLKEECMDRLFNKKFTDKGGAGVGFIDMARRTRHKITYETFALPNEQTIFKIAVKCNINRNQDI